jgi:hypothetical protein
VFAAASAADIAVEVIVITGLAFAPPSFTGLPTPGTPAPSRAAWAAGNARKKPVASSASNLKKRFMISSPYLQS